MNPWKYRFSSGRHPRTSFTSMATTWNGNAEEGTAAARWHRRFVPEAEKWSRVRTLVDLEQDPVAGLAVQYRRQLVGRTLRAIIEHAADGPATDSAEDRWRGRCDHYQMLVIRGKATRGEVVQVRVDELDGDRTLATIIRESPRQALRVLQPTDFQEHRP